MSFFIVNRSEVKSDILLAVNYYKKINPNLAKQFLHQIREAKAAIKRSPDGFQIKYMDVRTVLLKQFPFHIHYFIDSQKNQIVILAIIHSYRKPTDYSKRINDRKLIIRRRKDTHLGENLREAQRLFAP